MVIDDDLRCSSTNELYHKGIRGQKWGVQNGPPYPLDPNKDYSKAEKKALRKEYRKEIRRQKKAKKKYEKEENKRLKKQEEKEKIEEAKKKAIASGKASEIEKYKKYMTTDEINESLTRIKAVQDLERMSLNELISANDKTKAELTKIVQENNLRKEELIKKYGPGKAEAALDKASRISSNVGNIASNVQKVIGAKNLLTVGKKSTFELNKLMEKYKNEKRDAKRERLIQRVINSGDETLLNKHLNKLNNKQLLEASERIALLDPSGDQLKRIASTADRGMLKKYYKQLTNDQVKEMIEKINIMEGNAPDHRENWLA